MGGYDFGYGYDDIGNRKTTTTNGQSAVYTPTLLNQYTQCTVPGAVDVTGAAATDATVTVNLQPTQRQGERFYRSIAVNNTAAPQNTSLTIVGVKNNAGPAGEDVVSQVTKNAFVAQTPESYTYDLDGNLTADARWTYTWDAENRLTSLTTQPSAVIAGLPKQKLEFTYDAMGRRIQKKVSTWNLSLATWNLLSDTRFLYDGWNLLADLNGQSSNAVVCSYVWGLDLSGSLQGAGGVGGLLFTTKDGSTYASGYDGNGNIQTLTNLADGSTSADFEYDPFGNTIKANGAAANVCPFGFSTKYTDAETGLLYYGFRYYQPSTGRWLSRDPIGEDGGVNLYGFVDNNAVNGFDFLGLDVFLYFWNSSQGSSGSGHVGIGAGTPDKQDFFEANPEPSGAIEPMRKPYRQKGSVDQVVKLSADFVDYGQAPKLILRFKSCPDEDKKVVDALQAWFEGHPKWDIFTSNCADGAKCGLRSINISTDHRFPYSTPQELARYLYQTYGSQKDKVTVVSGDWLTYTNDNGTTGVLKKKSESALNATKAKVEAVIKSATTP